MLAQTYWLILIAVMGLILVVWFLAVARFFALWIRALFAGAKVGFPELIGMTLRKVNPRVIVVSRIRAVQAGLAVGTSDMEKHYLAGGNVPNVVMLMTAAKDAKLALTWEQATALDLAGEDLPALARKMRLRQITNGMAALPERSGEDIT